jgi:hypothetical protein
MSSLTRPFLRALVVWMLLSTPIAVGVAWVWLDGWPSGSGPVAQLLAAPEHEGRFQAVKVSCFGTGARLTGTVTSSAVREEAEDLVAQHVRTGPWWMIGLHHWLNPVTSVRSDLKLAHSSAQGWAVLTAFGDVIEISGQVPTARQKADLEAAVTAFLPHHSIQSHLTLCDTVGETDAFPVTLESLTQLLPSGFRGALTPEDTSEGLCGTVTFGQKWHRQPLAVAEAEAMVALRRSLGPLPERVQAAWTEISRLRQRQATEPGAQPASVPAATPATVRTS